MACVNADRCDRRLIDESRVLKSRKSLGNSMRRNATIAGTGTITSIKTNFGANDIVFGRPVLRRSSSEIVIQVRSRRRSGDRYFVKAP